MGAVAAVGLRPVRSVWAGASAQPGLAIVPRSQWAADLPPTGPVPDEPDVRFLLVHHTANRNDYDADGAVDLLRGIYRFHTGERGWPDIAYNFFVDRFGTVYEGRAGSLDGAKAGDATGGSQGFAQLCAFLGDHQAAPPTDVAVASMQQLLGWLAARHGIDLTPAATATFVSRGSNRHPAGTTVTTPTVAGHRDMSRTACPGDAAYGLIVDGTLARGAAAAATTTTTVAATTATTTTLAPSSTTAGPTGEAAAPAPARSEGTEGGIHTPTLVGVAAAAGALAALVTLRRRRT